MPDLLPLDGGAHTLPVYVPIRNGKICLTEDEILQAGEGVKRRVLTVMVTTMFAMFFALEFLNIVSGGSGGLWVFSQLLKVYVLVGFIVPAIMGSQAFSLVNDNQRARASMLCQSGLTISKWLVPIGPYLSMIGFGQPMAICRSMEGRHVDAQIILAQLSGICSSQALRTSLGNIYGRMGRFDLAEPIFLERLERAKGWTSSPLERAIAYNNVGWIYFLTGRYNEAKECLEEAIRHSRKTRRHPLVQIKSKVSLCRTLLRLGQIEDAEVLLEETWRAVDARSKSVYSSKSEAQTAFAELRLLQGRLDEALLHARTAQECAEVTSAPGSVFSAYACQLHAQILEAMGRLPESDTIKYETEAHQTELLEANTARMEQVRLNRKQAFRQICFDSGV
jgi:tetratricopeptide (TPR) repeat protein